MTIRPRPTLAQLEDSFEGLRIRALSHVILSDWNGAELLYLLKESSGWKAQAIQPDGVIRTESNLSSSRIYGWLTDEQSVFITDEPYW